MEVILIRHANSMGNARITTDLNSDLTELGYKQAEVTAKFLSEYLNAEWYQEGEIWSSPYKRTLKTSWAIAEETGLPVSQDFRLREIIQEQGHYNKDSFPLSINENKGWCLFKLEDNQQTIDRLQDFVYFTPTVTKKLIIVSHGIPTRILKDLFINYNDNSYKMMGLPEWDGTFKNCSITHIKDGEVILDRYTEHLLKGDCFI